jgi:hypothetical protein
MRQGRDVPNVKPAEASFWAHGSAVRSAGFVWAVLLLGGSELFDCGLDLG